jgi:hypothetical protein
VQLLRASLLIQSFFEHSLEKGHHSFQFAKALPNFLPVRTRQAVTLCLYLLRNAIIPVGQIEVQFPMGQWIFCNLMGGAFVLCFW